MAAPNRMRHGYYPNNPTQSPPIFDRSQLPQQGQGQQPAQHQLPAGQPVPYHGYGMGAMFQNLGKQFDVGSSIPTGGFGFDASQKTALAPLLQQLPGLINGMGRGAGRGEVMGPHGGLDMSGGILGALRSLGVDTGNMQGLGVTGDQRAQFLHSLQDFVTGIANRPPNRQPMPRDDFPGRDSPGHRDHGPPVSPPPYYYSPGHRRY